MITEDSDLTNAKEMAVREQEYVRGASFAILLA